MPFNKLQHLHKSLSHITVRCCEVKRSYANILSVCFGQSPIMKYYSHVSKLDPSKVTHLGTMDELKEKLSDKMGIQKGYKLQRLNRKHLLKYLPKNQADLPPRKMHDSYISALLPLSDDISLQEKYITFLQHVRIGRLLEDMDVFAVMVALTHIFNPEQPIGTPCPHAVVTVLVDQIDFSNYTPRTDADIRLLGHVCWVGKSSLEVVVRLEQMADGAWQNITRATFLMAARDPTYRGPAYVNPLAVETNEEKIISESSLERSLRRKNFQMHHVSKVVPTDEEQNLIHELFLRSVSIHELVISKRVSLPENCLWMEQCTLTDIVLSHPEDLNIHNTIFGGFIMRHTMELSWILGYLFSKHRPNLKSICDINFKIPIHLNSLIRMHAHVVFTYKQYFHIIVHVESWEAFTGKNNLNNSFHFTYDVPVFVQEVFPRTYHEAMMYVQGRRHFFSAMNESPYYYTTADDLIGP